jgi:hypothetical protein
MSIIVQRAIGNRLRLVQSAPAKRHDGQAEPDSLQRATPRDGWGDAVRKCIEFVAHKVTSIFVVLNYGALTRQAIHAATRLDLTKKKKN